MRTLVIIPARSGSKGLPGKNIRLLDKIPLLHYTIKTAKEVFDQEDICVSTDGVEIKKCAENAGLHVPFMRPLELSGDKSGTYEVIMHALQYYQSIGRNYDRVLLMQPTSPFRKASFITEMEKLYSPGIDMVVSVGLTHHNPYFSLFEESSEGFLVKSKDGFFENRQEAPKTYFYNGSLYLLNCESLRKSKIAGFKKVVKFVMDEIYCVDIDTAFDWMIAESIVEKKLYTYEHN